MKVGTAVKRATSSNSIITVVMLIGVLAGLEYVRLGPVGLSGRLRTWWVARQAQS